MMDDDEDDLDMDVLIKLLKSAQDSSCFESYKTLFLHNTHLERLLNVIVVAFI